MQLRTSTITAALLLSTGALAASAGSLQARNVELANRDVAVPALQVVEAPLARGLSTTKTKTKFGNIAKLTSSNLKKDAKALRKLNKHRKVTVAQAKPAVRQVAAHFATAGSQLQSLSRAIGPHAARSLDERQDILQGIIADLISGLDVIVPEVLDLIKSVLDAFGLDAVSDLIDILTPAITSFQTGLEQLLTAAGDLLGPLINPVLNIVSELLSVLFGNSKAPAVKQRAISASPANAKTIQHIRVNFASSKAHTAKLLKKKSVSQHELQSLVSGLVSNVRSAQGVVDSLRAAKTGVAARQLPDLGTIVTGLLTDLVGLLPGVEQLLTNLLNNLGLDGLADLISGLSPGLTDLLTGLQGFLQAVTDVLSPIVDPLFQALENLVTNLGTIISNLLGAII